MDGFCKYCGQMISSDQNFCSNCGAENNLNSYMDDDIDQTTYKSENGSENVEWKSSFDESNANVEKKSINRLGTIGFICSIFGLFNPIFGIIGIVFGASSLKDCKGQDKSKVKVFAILAIVIGIISLLISIIEVLVYVVPIISK